MNAILKGMAVLATCAFLSVSLGCRKEIVSGEPVSEVQKGLIVHCSPYRNVVGYYAMCADLNAVTNCMRRLCEGNSVTVVLTKYVLTDVNNSPFTFASNQTITIAQQNDVMVAAKAWANANTPAGYYVDYIQFQPDIIVSLPPVTYAGVDIIVTYRKCTGGGGPIG